MRLYEYEGKQLLEKQFAVPQPLQLGVLDELQWTKPCVLKAQVLFGNRAQKGLVLTCHSKDEWIQQIKSLTTSMKRLDLDPAKTLILVEPLLSFEQEILIGIRYDTRYRLPVLYWNSTGGTGIEEREKTTGEAKTNILPLTAFPPYKTSLTALQNANGSSFPLPNDWIQQLISLFWDNDLQLLEINPVVIIDNQPVILDAKIELDDQAAFRHPHWKQYPPRSLFGRSPTKAEKLAKEVNNSDHRGVAGASYFDLQGDIAIIAAGGGASILAMDTLLSLGLKPANYTEYSGNPPREKVAKLTAVVLSKPGLKALWVVGGHANFTDQYETLMGVMDGIEKSALPEDFLVVIRRGGPRIEEAYTALQKRSDQLNSNNKKINLHLFSSSTPISESAEVLQKILLRLHEDENQNTNSSNSTALEAK